MGIRWKLNWPMVLYMSFVHIIALLGTAYIHTLKWQTLALITLSAAWTGIGVTGGLHRLWAHRSYKAHWSLRLFLMLCTCLSNQGSIYHWVRDHRVHHMKSETQADPHNAKRGFFFSHMGWLLVKKDPKVIEAGKKLDLSDLQRDPIVMFQKKFDPWFALFICFVLPPLISYYFWNECIISHYMVEVTRYVFILHCTWLVNSAAHMWGNHPYDDSINPAENKFVAMFSLGEGWHNWHHKFPYDYAASEFGSLIRWNPTKKFIDICASFGMVTDRKRALDAWERVKLKKIEKEEQTQKSPRQRLYVDVQCDIISTSTDQDDPVVA